jgi:DNA-binding NarL/FixJ family response regulator
VTGPRQAGAHALLAAATSAMNAGYSLSEIAQAEARGKADVRTALRPDTLKRVERTGRNVRDAQTEHHRTIGRAVRLGLSTRQIAAAAGVTHGTVRAIANRVSAEGTHRRVTSPVRRLVRPGTRR